MHHYRTLGIIAFALLGLGGAWFFWTKSASATVGTLQLYQGSAEIARGNKQLTGDSGTTVRLKDTIKSPPGSITAVVLKDGSVIRLDAGTEVEVANLEYKGEKISQALFKIKTGRMWSRVTPLSPDGQWQVETPTAVAAIQGTSFNTTYRDHFTGMYVYRNTVTGALLQNRGTAKRIEAGYLLRMRDDRLGEDFSSGPHVAPDDFFDAWIRFNQAEDDALDGVPSVPTPSLTPSLSPLASPSSSPRYKPSVTALPPLPTYARPSPRVQSLRDVHPAPSVLAVPSSTASPQSVISVQPTTPTPTPTPKNLTSLQPTTEPRQLTNLRLSYTADQRKRSAQFTATAEYSDKTSADVTTQAKWTLSSPANGTISSTGFYTAGKKPGDTIMATYQNMTSSTSVDI